VSKEGTGEDHMVTILVGGASVGAGGKEAWSCDTRTSPILAVETTDLAMIAVRRAIEGKRVPAGHTLFTFGLTGRKMRVPGGHTAFSWRGTPA
jgi:hypothetical protein